MCSPFAPFWFTFFPGVHELCSKVLGSNLVGPGIASCPPGVDRECWCLARSGDVALQSVLTFWPLLNTASFLSGFVALRLLFASRVVILSGLLQICWG